jgi:hypothetical protein
VLGLPDEEIEQEAAEHHDPDGDGEQAGAGCKRQARDFVDRPHAKEERE